MKILGIDPGIQRMGWAVLECDNDGQNIKLLDGGCFMTKSTTSKHKRLYSLFSMVSDVFKIHKITILGIEKVFYTKNVKTAIVTGESRGVVLCLGGMHRVRVMEFTPSEVKQMISGYGNAGKAQMQEMVRLYLELDEIPEPDDFADAIAIALCVIQQNKFTSLK